MPRNRRASDRRRVGTASERRTLPPTVSPYTVEAARVIRRSKIGPQAHWRPASRSSDDYAVASKVVAPPRVRPVATSLTRQTRDVRSDLVQRFAGSHVERLHIGSAECVVRDEVLRDGNEFEELPRRRDDITASFRREGL